jgi:xanthine dehydrogenase large subunit
MNDLSITTQLPATPVVGEPVRHESAHLHVSGRALYADDIALPPNALHAAFGISSIAHGKIVSMDLSAVLATPGVIAVALAGDVPGENNYGGIVHDDPIFAESLVEYAGQPLFAVAATSFGVARKAAARARIQYEELPAILDIRSALAADSYVIPSQLLLRGEARANLPRAPHRLQGSIEIGGQDHFYLEGQIAIAIPQEDGAMLVHSSTQHPTEVQNVVAHTLGVSAHAIHVQCRRMGGGFGGKESQPALIAAAAAVLARKTQRPVKLRLDRDADMLITGKRHDFVADYDVGFGADGRIIALALMLASRCGYSADLSGPVNDRAICHVDNAYYIEHLELVSHRCKTHTVSNTAFRGFGGPQGMLVIEQIIDDIARTLHLDPLDVRRRNYYGPAPRDVTHYGQYVEDNILDLITDQLEVSSRYRARRSEIAQWNQANVTIKRGIALTPVKFGISFNATVYNQAGALVHIYTDGSVLLNHGGTEMGQGLYTKVAQVVAAEFGLPLERVRTSATDTSKVPNTSATAASSGADLNGKAAQAACQILRARLIEHACKLHNVAPAQVRFVDGNVEIGSQRMSFAQLVQSAYADRRDATDPDRYPARCRHVVESGDRSRPDRRRIPAGRGLADQRRTLVECERRTQNTCAIDLQDSDGARLAVACRRAHPRTGAESGRHDPPLQGRGRTAAHARHLNPARDPRCGCRLRARCGAAGSERAGDTRGGAARDRPGRCAPNGMTTLSKIHSIKTTVIPTHAGIQFDFAYFPPHRIPARAAMTGTPTISA